MVAKKVEQKTWLTCFNQELKFFFASRMGCPKIQMKRQRQQSCRVRVSWQLSNCKVYIESVKLSVIS